MFVCMPDIQAQVTADGGCRVGTANMTLTMQSTQQRKRMSQFGHHVARSCTFRVLHHGFPVRLCIQAGGAFLDIECQSASNLHMCTHRTEVTPRPIGTRCSKFIPRTPPGCDYFLLEFIGNDALLGSLQRKRGGLSPGGFLFCYVRDSSAGCCCGCSKSQCIIT